jgi:Na+/proline symporter
VQAVTWVDVKQMFLIVGALLAVVITLLVQIPLSPGAALHAAGAAGRLRVFDFSFSVTNTYTFWSGLIGGTFLMLSYFGTDQSQVQRYLSAKSVEEARSSLLISAYWKIPLQALVLLVGVLVFVFYETHEQPILFNPSNDRVVRAAEPAQYAALEQRFRAATSLAATRFGASCRLRAHEHGDASGGEGRQESRRELRHSTIRHRIPADRAGGIFIAAVIAAAMNAISGELTSLSTATVIDFYRRWIRHDASDAHFLVVSRAATVFWGIFACIVAKFAVNLGIADLKS